MIRRLRKKARSDIENVIVGLLEQDDIYGAIDIAKKINPRPEFASIFADELLIASADRETETLDKFFVDMKEIAKEDITEEEADAILLNYIGPNGKKQLSTHVVPKKILQASSIEMMTRFYGYIIESGDLQYAKTIWPYLEKKIKNI